jgi:CheY-like chemotaxis protein
LTTIGRSSICCRLLEVEGYEVATAVDGAEAIELALSFDPTCRQRRRDADVGGLELCRRLKEDRARLTSGASDQRPAYLQTRPVSKVCTQAPTTISISRSETKSCW